VKSILLTLTLSLALESAATAQAQTSTIQGRVIRNSTGEMIPNTKVSLNTMETFQTLSAVVNASATLILGREASEAAVRYLTLPASELEAEIADLKERSITPDMAAALNRLQAARKGATGLPRVAFTDNLGRFSFSDVPPGSYMLVTEREGFYGIPTSTSVVPYATAAIDITNRPAPPETTITMTSGALISGRVRDENGRPQVNANVQAFTTTYKAGLPVLEAVTEKTTDDRGEYRLFWLPAGEYLVAVTPRPTVGQPGASNSMNLKTFHPSAPQPALATPVKVRVGDEVANVDVDLRPIRTVKVSGRVVNSLGPRTDLPAGAPVPDPVVALMLLQRDASAPDDTRNSVIGMVPIPAGVAQFELSNILPGRYDFLARLPDPRGSRGQGGQALAWGRTQIEVFDRDLTDVVLTVHASVEVKGTLTLNGAAPGAAASTIRVALTPDGSSSKQPNFNGVVGRPATPAPADGAFAIPSVAEANYRFVISGLPGGAYVEDIRAGARSVFDSGLYVDDKAPDGLQILVNGGGGTVEGTVTTATRRPSAGSTVVLVPEPSRRQNATLFKTAIANAEGAFSFQGVRPGSYRVFAWESISDGAYLNPLFLSKYEANGVAASVGGGTTSNVAVTVIPKN
jgi:hypothetical protein